MLAYLLLYKIPGNWTKTYDIKIQLFTFRGINDVEGGHECNSFVEEIKVYKRWQVWNVNKA